MQTKKKWRQYIPSPVLMYATWLMSFAFLGGYLVRSKFGFLACKPKKTPIYVFSNLVGQAKLHKSVNSNQTLHHLNLRSCGSGTHFVYEQSYYAIALLYW